MSNEHITDEEIIDVARQWSNSAFATGNSRFVLDFARAILALRPAAQPREAREAAQRERMVARLFGRPAGPATADFDLPAPNDSIPPIAAAQPADALGALEKRNIFDAIRCAYDLGYNDARNARAVPGDSAPGYDGRNVESDHGSALFNTMNRRLSEAKQTSPKPAAQPVGEPSPNHTKLLRMLARRARCFPAYPIGYHIPEVFAALGEDPPDPFSEPVAVHTPHPSPERVPMTDEQIMEAEQQSYVDGRRPIHSVDCWGDEKTEYEPTKYFNMFMFARAIEAHHGITTPKTDK